MEKSDMEKPVLKESTLEIQDRVAVMTFNRDDVRNAHDQETSQACPAGFFAGLSGFMRLLSGDGTPHG
jgi:hypothetical protein